MSGTTLVLLLTSAATGVFISDSIPNITECGLTAIPRQAETIRSMHGPLMQKREGCHGEETKQAVAVITALTAVIGSEDQAAVTAFIQMLKDQSPEIRAKAIDSLGKMGPLAIDAIPVLISVLKKDPNSVVRDRVIDALGKLGPNATEAVPALILVLKNDPDWILRGNSARALGQIASKDAIHSLIMAMHDKMPYVRAAAAQAIVRIGVNRDVRRRMSVFIRALDDDNYWVRAWAVQILAKCGADAKTAIPEITKIIRTSKDLSELGPFYDALARMGDAGFVTLVKAYQLADKGGNEWARYEIGAALAGAGEAAKAAVAGLHKVLQHAKDRRVRIELCNVLAAIGPAAREVVPTLTAALNDKDSSVRDAAALALWRIEPQVARDAGAPAPVVDYLAWLGVSKADFEKNRPAISATGHLGENLTLSVNGVPIPLNFGGGWIVGLNKVIREGKNELLVAGRHKKPLYIIITAIPNNNSFLMQVLGRGELEPNNNDHKPQRLLFNGQKK